MDRRRPPPSVDAWGVRGGHSPWCGGRESGDGRCLWWKCKAHMDATARASDVGGVVTAAELCYGAGWGWRRPRVVPRQRTWRPPQALMIIMCVAVAATNQAGGAAAANCSRGRVHTFVENWRPTVAWRPAPPVVRERAAARKPTSEPAKVGQRLAARPQTVEPTEVGLRAASRSPTRELSEV